VIVSCELCVGHPIVIPIVRGDTGWLRHTCQSHPALRCNMFCLTMVPFDSVASLTLFDPAPMSRWSRRTERSQPRTLPSMRLPLHTVFQVSYHSIIPDQRTSHIALIVSRPTWLRSKQLAPIKPSPSKARPPSSQSSSSTASTGQFERHGLIHPSQADHS
jgi:hypothetical protein